MPRSRSRRPRKSNSKSRKPKQCFSFAGEFVGDALERRKELFEEVRQEVVAALPAECRQICITEPQESQDLLHQARIAIEQLGINYAQAMGSYAWLFYLRRMPMDLVEGNLPNSAIYRLALAEALSSNSSVAENYSQLFKRRVIPPIDRRSAETLVKLCGVATQLHFVHSAIRRAGKGQSIRWSNDSVPVSVANRDLDRAIEIYDSRVVSNDGQVLGHGLQNIFPLFRRLDQPVRLSDVIIMLFPTLTEEQVIQWMGPLSKLHAAKGGKGRYTIYGATFDGIKAIVELANSTPSWAQSGLASLIIFQRAVFNLIYFGNGDLGSSLPSVGYFTLPIESLQNLINLELHSATSALQALNLGPMPTCATDVYEDVASMRAQLWPFAPGPILRNIGNRTVIDMSAATNRLTYLTTVQNKVPEKMIKARAGNFELFVQGMIDKSRWAPSKELRNLRGRTLRLDGKHITDIDAIASIDGNLLLVSCKSMPYTLELDAGYHSKVRNIRTAVEEYDAEWVAKIEFFKLHPRGDNYDFSGFNILGVVAIPFVPFVHAHQTRKAAIYERQYLRAVCSTGELETFLSARY